MSIQTELQDLATYLTNAYAKCSDKGATIPQDKNMYNLADCIDSITGGGTIIPPEAGNCLSIAIGSLPDKTSYVEGEDLDLTGLVVNGNFSSGMVIDVTNSCTITASDPVDYYYPLISISYEQGGNTFTTSFNITVTGIPVPAPASTKLLYHFNNDLLEEVTGNTVTPISTTVSYSQGKFAQGVIGWGSLGGWNLNQNIEITNEQLRTNNYTIEFWTKGTSSNFTNFYNTLKVGCPFFASNQITSAGLKMDVSGSSTNWSFASSCTVDHIATDYNWNAWHHVAVVVLAGNYKTYLDGILSCHGVIRNHTDTKLSNFTFNANNMIADEFMVCAEAKYLANFTPNHAPYYIPSST